MQRDSTIVVRMAALVSCAAFVLAVSDRPAGQTQATSTPPTQLSYDELIAAPAKATRSRTSFEFQVPLPPPQTRGRETLETTPNPAGDFEDYSRKVVFVVYKLNEYWSQAVPQVFKRQFRQLTRVHQYEPSTVNKGYPCFGKFLVVNNAFYCSDIHAVQWHWSWMYGKFVKEGDFAMAAILAHEWGHAYQSHLSQNVSFEVQQELQADCLAGVWSSWAGEQSFLDPGDIREGMQTVYRLGDAQMPWFNPKGHGTGEQRIRSFAQGLASGTPLGCAVK